MLRRRSEFLSAVDTISRTKQKACPDPEASRKSSVRCVRCVIRTKNRRHVLRPVSTVLLAFDEAQSILMDMQTADKAAVCATVREMKKVQF